MLQIIKKNSRYLFIMDTRKKKVFINVIKCFLYRKISLVCHGGLKLFSYHDFYAMHINNQSFMPHLND